MTRLLVGDWAPDQPALGNKGLVDVINAVPALDHWLPQRGPVPVVDQEVTPPIEGLWTARRTQGDNLAFVAFGGSIYLTKGMGIPLEDVGFGTYAPGARWRTAQNADLLIATNFADEVQVYSLDTGGLFGILSLDCPKAKYIAQIRDFTVLAYINDTVDGVQAYRIQWHGFTNGLADPTNWTTGQADFATVNDIGQIQGLTGGRFGTVVCEYGAAVVRGYSAKLFEIEVIEQRLGTRVPNSVNYYRQNTYYYSPEGWVQFGEGGARKIGLEKIDRWFRDEFDESTADKMWCDVDDFGHLLWLFCGRGHNGVPNRILRYAPELDKWSKSHLLLDALGGGQTFGGNLDSDFFDNFEVTVENLDDPGLWDDIPRLLVVSGNRLASLTGGELEAAFTMGEFQFAGDRNRAMLRELLVGARGGAAQIQVATRERQVTDEQAWSVPFGPQSDGWFRCRFPGRTHQLRLLRSGSWANTQGLDAFAGPLGGR